MVLGCFATALAGLVFAHNSLLTLALPLALLSGAAFLLTVLSCNVLLQSLVGEHLRGRVMSLYSISVMGLTPFASLSYGLISRHWGVPTTFMVAGTLAFVYAIRLRSGMRHAMMHARPVLKEKGMLAQ